MALQRPQPARGFTLIETLVAAALIGLVMGLAVRGFGEAKKIGDLAKSRAIARQEANLGVQKIARLLSRAHIIFFDTRPLKGSTAETATGQQTQLNNIRFDTPPATLLSGTVAGADVQVAFGTTAGSQTWVQPFGLFANSLVSRSRFRVRHLDDAAAKGLEDAKTDAGLQLYSGEFATNKPSALTSFDASFPSPLLYCAEATILAGRFGAAGTDPEVKEISYPVTWTFHVVYLAPMRFEHDAARRDEGNGLFPVQEDSAQRSHHGWRDMGRAYSNGGLTTANWTRATVPYEIRCLTIPDVPALTDTDLTAATLTATTPGKVLGRHFDSISILPAPHDVPEGKVNFDPLPLGDDIGTKLSDPAPVFGVPGSGTRVRGTPAHGNWRNVGNDPPHEDVFATARGLWDPVARKLDLTKRRDITDTVLCSYIDPDSIHGTCVRLGNDWLRDDGEVGLIAKGETAPRPYVNAMGGPQKYCPKWWAAANPIALDGPPKRALVSVSTRFRYTRQTAFAFATESVEVELETLNRFQKMDFRQSR